MLNRLYNTWKKIFTAIRFPQFTLKLLQISLFEKAVKRGFIKQTQYPLSIVIRATEKCFLHCVFCGQGGDKGRVDRKHLEYGPIEIETFRKIHREIIGWSIKPFVKITGGEPLTMGKPLIEIISKMRASGIVVKLNTNGVLLKSPKIARSIVETDVNYLSISIDGLEETHDRIRGVNGTFRSALLGVDNVVHLRQELKKKNLMILISMVVSSENYLEIEPLYRILVEHEIDWFNIQFLNFTTEETCAAANAYMHPLYGVIKSPWTAFSNPQYNAIDPVVVNRQINQILALRKSLPVSVMGGLSSRQAIHDYYFTLKPIVDNPCYIPATAMHIVPPGKACFCIDYPYLEYGDLRNQSIQEIWNSETALHFRQDIQAYFREHGINYPQCQRCNWRFN